MKTETTNMPMNLQFFAESANEPETKDADQIQEPETKDQEQIQEPDKPSTPTIEEVMAETAKEKAEKEKNKVALDRALRELGEVKKALRQKMTAQEQEDEAKREQEEQHNQYVASLEEFKHRTEAKDRYLLQGMTVEMAAKAAEAEVSGDMDRLTEIQRQHTEATLKNAKAEWQKSIPQPQYGVGEYSSMTKEEIMAIKDPVQRRNAIARNLDKFK